MLCSYHGLPENRKYVQLRIRKPEANGRRTAGAESVTETEGTGHRTAAVAGRKGAAVSVPAEPAGKGPAGSEGQEASEGMRLSAHQRQLLSGTAYFLPAQGKGFSA